MDAERRRNQPQPTAAAARRGLSPQQHNTLNTMEQLGWRLAFVRRPLFQAPLPVLFNASSERWVVLEPEGSIAENPGLKLRSH